MNARVNGRGVGHCVAPTGDTAIDRRSPAGCPNPIEHAWCVAVGALGCVLIHLPGPDEERYSGQMLLRLPKLLHARLAEQAGRENVSVNQFAMTLIAEGVGREQSSLLADVERALDTSRIPPGPGKRRLRRVRASALRAADQLNSSSDPAGRSATSWRARRQRVPCSHR